MLLYIDMQFVGLEKYYAYMINVIHFYLIGK